MRSHTWEVDRLDLDAYLQRIEFEGHLQPDLATLRALARTHIARIPFENFEIGLGRGVDPELDAIIEKVISRRRGGYCFEHAVLFAAACEQIGFKVVRLLARVGSDGEPAKARTHMTLQIQISGGELYLCDVGFGSGLLTPLRWEAGIVEQQGDWTFSLVDTGARGWHLRRLTAGDEWQTLQWIFTDPVEPIDVELANYYVATHSDSPFSAQAVAIRTTEQASYLLRGRRSTVSVAGGGKTERELSSDELVRAWREEYRIPLSDDEVEQLLQFVGGK